ncbi:MAG: DEAD/DEAH box helicase [Halobacteriovoraceae bacterium]|jgi:superfamily II DNA/RNA helicase|nr:DEAD/DEAH box helicase [Halobacteriovoraceae bacterium]
MQDFEKLGIDEDFNPFYKEHGIKKPTEVQTKIIPKIMENQSVVCVAQTGTGKTLAYALPISELIKKAEDENGLSAQKSKPIAVILSPTKELAVQIQQVFKQLSHHVKLRTRTLVGTPKSVANLKTQSYEILIATPNKLLRALKKGDISFDNLQYFVMDEADQLFDMGFKKDIDGTMNFIDYGKTDIHFFSATMPIEVETYLNEKFEKKKLEKIHLSSSHHVQQQIETYNIFVDVEEKMRMMQLFLEKTAKGRGIIFVNQRNQVEEVNEFLQEKLPKLKYRILHGALSQKDRLANHKAFVDGKAQVLVASDVMARGIDVKDLEWVFNYGLPKTAIYYLHRCGRTGRAGKTGIVYNLVTKFDTKIINQINESIKKQSTLNLSFITNDIKDEKKRQTKKKVKLKSKRVKVTKRTRL